MRSCIRRNPPEWHATPVAVKLLYDKSQPDAAAALAAPSPILAKLEEEAEIML